MSPDALHKVCPRCGGEFQTWVEQCVDCEVPLVWPGEAAAAGKRAGEWGEPEEPEDDSAFEDWVYVRSEAVAWIRTLAAELEAAGIAVHIEPAPRGQGNLLLFVAPEDEAEARRIDAAFYRREVLDREAGTEPQPERGRPLVRRTGDAAPGIKVCPSCGGEYQEWVERCADCGVPLVFPGAAVGWEAPEELDEPEEPAETAEPAALAGEQEGRCPACGAALPPHPTDCPECGLGLGAPEED